MTKLRALLIILVISWLLRGVGNSVAAGLGNYFVLTSLVLGAFGSIPAYIASRKGRNFGKWWLYGWLLFGLAIIHSVIIKPEK